MEVYVLDSLLRRERVIDLYESLIWTERFNAAGDFAMTIRSTLENRAVLRPGVRLAMQASWRIMTIETVEVSTDTRGQRILRVSGFSLESILMDRIAMPSLTSATWPIEDEPADIARKIFDDICRTGVISLDDKIPFLMPGTLLPLGNIPEPLDPIKVDFPPKTVYDAIKAICDVYTLGFRLIRNYDTSELYFEIYSGYDRTSGQATQAPVIFSPDLDNLENTKELSSIESSKNVAYVVSPAGSLVVFPVGVPPDTEGFDRRVLFVDANDITTESVTDVTVALEQRGKEELANYRAFQAFDGEISQSGPYLYQRDYTLGDLVEMRNVDGVINQMRVTEQIFVSDAEGIRSYPTLTMNQFINLGSWLSWEQNKVWFDYEGDPISWSELP
jgi:hypothetical protein